MISKKMSRDEIDQRSQQRHHGGDLGGGHGVEDRGRGSGFLLPASCEEEEGRKHQDREDLARRRDGPPVTGRGPTHRRTAGEWAPPSAPDGDGLLLGVHEICFAEIN